MKIHTLLNVLLFAFCAATVSAQETYPNTARPISVVVPFGAGSGTDVITRIIVAEMSKHLGGSMVVLNKAGASGQIGTEFVAKAPSDGYTLLVGTNTTHSANPHLFKSLRYDAIKDFSPIGRMTINPLAFLVSKTSAFNTPADLLGFAKANPGKLTYGYGNTGGQVSAGLLVHMTKMDAAAIPYKTTPQLFTDIINGQVDFGFVDFAASRAFITGGRLKALATTSDERLPAAPQVPVLKETPGLERFSIYAWLGLLAPAGTPDSVTNRLNEALRLSLENPEIKRQLESSTGSMVTPTSVQEFRDFVAEQSAVWKTSIESAAIVIQ